MKFQQSKVTTRSHTRKQVIPLLYLTETKLKPVDSGMSQTLAFFVFLSRYIYNSFDILWIKLMSFSLKSGTQLIIAFAKPSFGLKYVDLILR